MAVGAIVAVVSMAMAVPAYLLFPQIQSQRLAQHRTRLQRRGQRGQGKPRTF